MKFVHVTSFFATSNNNKLVFIFSRFFSTVLLQFSNIRTSYVKYNTYLIVVTLIDEERFFLFVDYAV